MWLSLLVVAVSSGREPLLYDICICKGTCPSACKDMPSFKLSDITNVTETIEKTHSSFLDVFTDADITDSHKILLGVFKKTKARFTSLVSTSKPVIEFQVDSDSDYLETELEFDGITAKFTGSQSKLALKALTMKKSATQIDASISVEALQYNVEFESLKGLDKITVRDGENSGAFISISGTAESAHRAMGPQHIVTLSVNGQYLDVYIPLTSLFELECNRNKVSVSANDIGTIVNARYLNPMNLSVNGEFPKTDNELVLETGTVGIEFRSDHSKFPFLINSTGDVYLTVFHDDSEFDREIFVTGTFWIDSHVEGVIDASIVFDNVTAGKMWLESDHMKVKMNYFICHTEVDSLPIVFSVGVNGVSTFEAKEIVNITQSPYETVYCHLNFDSFKTDAELEKLLTTEWDVITLDELEYENEESDIKFVDGPVVHGFSNTTEACCLKAELELSNKHLKIVFKKNKPVSAIQRTICYQSSAAECKDPWAVIVKDESKLGDLSSELLLEGMENVSFMIGTATEKLDLSNLKQTQVNITAFITYDSTDFAAYVKVGNPNKNVQALQLKKAKIGKELVLGIPIVTLSGCKKESSGKITVGDSTIVYVDQPTLSSGLVADSKIPDLVVNLVADAKISMKQSSWSIDSNELLYDNIEQLMLSTENDLKIERGDTATTLKGFVAVFHESSKVTIASDFSSVTKISPACMINHAKNELKLVSYYPFIHESMTTLGTGEVTYVNDFQATPSKYCICEGDSCNKCEAGRTQISYSSASSTIKGVAAGGVVDCQLLGTTRTKKPSIILSATTSKTVTISGPETEKQYLELDDMEAVENLRFSTLILEHIFLSTKATDQKIDLGVLVATDVTMDQSTEELVVDELTCEFELISGFRKVDVTDNIHLSGKLVDKETQVTFIEGDSIQIIHMTLPDASKVVLGKGVVTVGKMKFVTNGGDDREMRAIVTPEEGASVEFTSEAVPVSELPKVQILATANSNIIFSGEWKDWKQPVYDIVFNITKGDEDTSTVTIKENVVPMTIWNLDDYNLVVESTTAGMTGPLRVYKDAPLLSQKGHDTERVTLNLYGGLYIEHCDVDEPVLKIMSSQLDLDIEFIDMERQLTQYDVIFWHYVDLHGCSSISVDKVGDYISYKTDVIYFQSSLTGFQSDAALEPLLSKNHTLLSAPRRDFNQITNSTFVFVDDRDPKKSTHGFKNASCVFSAVFRNEHVIGGFYHRLIVTAPVKPSQMPMKICAVDANADETCEMNLTKTDLQSSMDTYIGPDIKNVTLLCNFDSIQVDFSKCEKLNLNFTSYKFQPIKVTFTAKSGSFNNLTLAYIDIQDSATIADAIKSTNMLNMTQVTFPKKYDIQYNIVDTDFDSFSSSQLEQAEHLTIRHPDRIALRRTNRITIIDDSEQPAKEIELSFGKIFALHFLSQSHMELEVEEGVSIIDIASITFIDPECEIVFKGDWTRPSLSLGDLVVNSPYNSHILAKTETYWYPEIFDESTRVEHVLLPIEGPLDLPYTFPIKDQVISYDVSVCTVDKHAVGDYLSFQGESGFVVSGASAPTEFKGVLVNDSTTAVISDSTISESLNLTRMANLSADKLYAEKIIMEWQSNEFPILILKDDNIQGTLTLNYTGGPFDDATMNELLYRKCYGLITFTSNDKCDAYRESHPVQFVSPYSAFATGDDCVFETGCDDDTLYVVAAREIGGGPGPTTGPTSKPTSQPTSKPTSQPTSGPTSQPTSQPTSGPTSQPTSGPTYWPTESPTASPSENAGNDPGLIFALSVSMAVLVLAIAIIGVKLYRSWVFNEREVESKAVIEKYTDGLL